MTAPFGAFARTPSVLKTFAALTKSEMQEENLDLEAAGLKAVGRPTDCRVDGVNGPWRFL